MQTTHVIGIDPGLVHTGLVRMVFNPIDHDISVQSEVVEKASLVGISDFVDTHPMGVPPAWVFIEDYRPRSHYQTDLKMVELVRAIKNITEGKTLLNYGVKQVVKRPLMEMLGVWKFSTPTHHQDLRSAARIALLGMLKDGVLNNVVTTVVRDQLDGNPWRIR